MMGVTARYKERLRAQLGPDWLDAAHRPQVTLAIRAFLDAERDAIGQEFLAHPTGGEYCAHHSALFDTVLSACFDLAWSAVQARSGPLPMDADVCVVAIGGYGRAHLAPWSDIDLAFVPMVEEHDHIDAIIREMLDVIDQVLVPGQHPHVAHSYRPLGDLDYIDHQSSTALLESRFVAGDLSLYMHLMQAVIASMAPVDFTFQNAAERAAVWRDRRQSLYAVEPNLKSSPGGLRDFHAAVWVAKVVFRLHDWDVLTALRQRALIGESEQTAALEGLETILRARNWLHLRRGQKLDVLHREYQQPMALGLGYRDHDRVAAAEDLMRDIYHAAQTLADFSRRLLAVCRDQRMEFRHGCFVERWVIEPAHDNIFREDPTRLLALFGEAQALELQMSVRLRQLMASNIDVLTEDVVSRRDVGEQFLSLLRPERQVAKTLRGMLSLHVFERMLPELAPLMFFLPSDQAHEYTVGEHSLKVVEELQRLYEAPLGGDEKILSDALHYLQEPEVLIFAALFHDVGKLDGTGHHAETGVPRARRAAERLGMQEHQIERVSFLIREHLTMMRTARLKPLQIQDTIEEFVDKLPTDEALDALDMLTCLNYADTRSVGQNVLKDTDRRLLMELFAKAARWIQERPLQEGAGDDETAGRALRRLTRAPALKDLDPEKVRAHLARLPVWYAVNTTPPLVAKHIGHLERVDSGDDPVVDFYQALGAKHTELTVCTRHRPGLLRDIAGAISASNLDIYLCGQEVALATATSPREAICTIWLDDFGQSVTQPKRERLAADLTRVLRGEQTATQLLEDRGRAQPDVVVYSVDVSNSASRQYTVVSFRAADERGLLYRLADALACEDLDIRVAKVTTWRSAAEDAFYVVSSQTGAKLTDRQTMGLGGRLAGHLVTRPGADTEISL